ncbi:MAG TPA: hypothetical protein VJP07_09845 [Dehalococcoidia bacterium]|nr:hypothetical protein [Dehalococcoidia bacterium]
MFRIPARLRGGATALAALILVAIAASGCGAIPFTGQPASGYVYGSAQPLRVAIIDTSGPEWTATLQTAMQRYSDAAGGKLVFQPTPEGANIVVTVRTYRDSAAPQLKGYDFPKGAGGFATIYDAQGLACNYPPSTLPLNCSGEITTTEIWLNEAIPAGADIEARRVRLIQHELGHAMGLTRHAPDLDIATLAQRYGWTTQQ